LSARRELSLVCVHRLIEFSRSVWRELSLIHTLTFVPERIVYRSRAYRELSLVYNGRDLSLVHGQRELSLVLVVRENYLSSLFGVCGQRELSLIRRGRELSISCGKRELSLVVSRRELSLVSFLLMFGAERIVSCPYSQRELSLVLVSCSQPERIIPR